MLRPEPSATQQPTTGTALSSEQQRKIGELLSASSRTFALTIPMLPEDLRPSVELAYLLLRAADAIEDATQLMLPERLELLRNFQQQLAHQQEWAPFADACAGFAVKLEPGGERSVLSNMELLFGSLEQQDAAASEIIRSHCGRVILRMIHWLNQGTSETQLTLQDFGELSDYMYSVAGIVGELLTDLFARYDEHCPRLSLLTRAPDFGAALQLTNIIKDAGDDAREGRQFLPENLFFIGQDNGNERLSALIELAEVRLAAAIDYICLLPESQEQIRLFCLAPVVLALATLEALTRRANEAIEGATIKIERAAVPELLLRTRMAVKSNQAVHHLHAQLTEQIKNSRATSD